jgi:glycosyltransferase involved in cell wall biosynthesis
LVITDDNSTDNTIQIIESFARNAPFPIRLERNSERLGYRENFMRAAHLCKSDIISFCDQDDIWDERKLESCLNGFYDESVLLVYHNALVVSENLIPIGTLNYLGRKKSTIDKLEMGPLLFPLGFTLSFRRSILTLSKYWTKSINYNHNYSPESHDQWIPFLANTFGCVVYLNKQLVKYRRHTNNAGIGARWRSPGITRLVRIVAPDTSGWSSFVVTFGRRAEILEEIAASPPEGFSAQSASRGAAHYRAYEELYRLRVNLYKTDFFADRAGLFFKIARNGGYRRNDPWSKGWVGACKDIIRGILHL